MGCTTGLHRRRAWQRKAGVGSVGGGSAVPPVLRWIRSVTWLGKDQPLSARARWGPKRSQVGMNYLYDTTATPTRDLRKKADGKIGGQDAPTKKVGVLCRWVAAKTRKMQVACSSYFFKKGRLGPAKSSYKGVRCGFQGRVKGEGLLGRGG